VNYELFVRAVIRKMSGRTDSYHATVKTKMKEDFSVRGGKHAVVLGRFDGEYFEALKPQMPGMVSPMQEADGFILITPEVKTLTQESFVNMLPIRWECSSTEKATLYSN
jgi:molybdopterin molybdotransferase